MHKIEENTNPITNDSIFVEGLRGWGMILSKFKRKQPEQMSQQLQQQKPPILPKKDGWSI